MARQEEPRLADRMKDLRARGLVKRGVPFAWAYCTHPSWKGRRAVGFVFASSRSEARTAARRATNYFRALGCAGHPGVFVWPDPELVSAPLGPRFRLGRKRVRFSAEEDRQRAALAP